MEWSCLKGMRVLELARLLPGPYCCLCLADFGADVIKVEEPPFGDHVRLFGQDTYDWLNRDKRSVGLDLRKPADRERFLELASTADVVVEGFRPGVMDRLGVGYEVLRSLNPAIVLCSITGFGQTGPNAQRAGHDLVYLAQGGYWALPSQLENPVTRPRLRLSDVAASLYAALSVAVAVMSARQSGKGQHIDVSITDSVLAWTLPKLMDAPPAQTVDEMSLIMPDNDIFETADHQHLVIGVLEDKFWIELAAHLREEEPELSSPRYRERRVRMAEKREVNFRLARAFRRQTLVHWTQRFNGTNVPWSPVLGADAVRVSPQAAARGIVQRVDGEEGSFDAFPFPVKFSAGGRDDYRRAPRAAGSDTEDVLSRRRRPWRAPREGD